MRDNAISSASLGCENTDLGFATAFASFAPVMSFDKVNSLLRQPCWNRLPPGTN